MNTTACKTLTNLFHSFRRYLEAESFAEICGLLIFFGVASRRRGHHDQSFL